MATEDTIGAVRQGWAVGTDCANAQLQMALMADGLGLGTTMIGFFILGYRFIRRLGRRRIGLPKDDTL